MKYEIPSMKSIRFETEDIIMKSNDELNLSLDELLIILIGSSHKRSLLTSFSYAKNILKNC